MPSVSPADRPGAPPGAAAPPGYRLKVEHFGPIVAAEVEFRPLTVFVGPNDTGKSWLAALLYSLHRNAAWGEALADRSIGSDALPFVASADDLPDALARGVRDWLTAAGSPPAFPADLEAALRAAGEKKLAEAVGHELRRCFSVSDLTDLNRWSSSAPTAIEWEASPSAPGASSLSLDISRDSVSASIGNLASASPDDCRVWRRSLMTAEREGEEIQARYLASEVTKSVVGNGFASLLKPAHFLPAERIGLVRHHRTVVANLIRAASTGGLRSGSRSGPTLPGIAADFLERVVSMRRAEGNGRNAAVVAELERDLLGGKIEVRPNAFGYPEFTYRPDAPGSLEIPLTQASATVSGLAPLALYLQRPVRPGDVLIVEEPEAHLHPEKQVALARLFARMIRSGIRLVITTHSEWLLETIANLVRLSSLPEDRRAGLRDAELALRVEEVGVWLFRQKKRSRGSTVERIEVDPESGVYPADYEEVAEALYNQNAEIYNRSQEVARA